MISGNIRYSAISSLLLKTVCLKLIGYMYIINPTTCSHCGNCQNECPMAAISEIPNGTLVIDPDSCTDCGSCADLCPEDAIRGA